MAKYSVMKGNPRLLDEYEGDRIYGDTYIINKDGAPTYEVTLSTLGDFCNCPGSVHHGKCKHLQMAYDYRTEFGL
jgi:hypothetical protein